MNHRGLTPVLALLSVLIVFASRSTAQGACYQNAPQTTIYHEHFVFYSGQTYLPYGSECLCGDGVPRGYADCWIYTDQSYATCPTCRIAAGQPINLATGNTFVSQTDISIPGLGGGMGLGRTWNSMPTGGQSAGMFGMDWVSTYEEKMFIDSDGLVKYSTGTGDLWSFGVTTLFGTGNTSTYSAIAPRNSGASLLGDGTHLIITFKNGEKRVFNQSNGQLQSITDRNGNATQLTYDSSNRLTTVTDAASRHLYFNYAVQGYPNLVSSVTSDFGVSLTYVYSTNYLVKVIRPDNTFVTFDYAALTGSTTYLLADVKDQNGKILESHTYDYSNRGLSSQKASGVDAVSITYLQ